MDIRTELQEQETKYGNVYSDIMFALNDIEDFDEDTNLKDRFYYRASKLLKDYLEIIDNLDYEINKKVGFFEKIKQKNIIEKKYNELNNFKNRNLKDFNKLSNCSKCNCLKCIANCDFNPCNRCKEQGKVNFCDRENENLINFNNLVEQQYNYESSKYENIDILSEIIVNNKRYRMIYDREEKTNLILYFDYSLKDGNIYDAVADDDENLDRVIEIFESNKY